MALIVEGDGEFYIGESQTLTSYFLGVQNELRDITFGSFHVRVAEGVLKGCKINTY